MEFKLILLCGVLAITSAEHYAAPIEYAAPGYAQSYPAQLSYAASANSGSLNHYSGHYTKALVSPKVEVRGKAIDYPVVVPPVYEHGRPAPSYYTRYASPPMAVYNHQAHPIPVTYTHSPSSLYHQAKPNPAVYSHSQGTVHHQLHPAHVAYSHHVPEYHNSGAAPTVYASKTWTYSPANMVSHVDFNGMGIHYGW